MFLETINSPTAINSLHSKEGINYLFNSPYTTVYVRNAGASGLTSGRVLFDIYQANASEVEIGDMCYVYSAGAYFGWHKITRVLISISNRIAFETNRAFTTPETVQSRVFYSPKFELRTGLGSALRPNKTIAAFNSEPNPQNQYRVSVNVSEFLKKDFPIKQPISGVDQNLFNDFRLVQVIRGVSANALRYTVYNSTVTHAELKKAVDNGILSEYKPILFSCGKNIYSTLLTVDTIDSEGEVKRPIIGVVQDGETGEVTAEQDRFLATMDGRKIVTADNKKILKA
jgi:hypothetical protein